MKEDQYRTATFSQNTGLQAAYDRRLLLIQLANQHVKEVSDGKVTTRKYALVDGANVASTEYKVVEKLGGLCETLVMKWLKLKIRDDIEGSAPRKDQVPREKRVALINRPQTFDKGFERRAHHAVHNGQYGIENYYGLVAKIEYSNGGNGGQPTTEWAAKRVADSTHEYFHHQINCPKYKGNHSLAYYTSGGKMGMNRHVYMFDPDYGEYKVPVGDFAKWLPKFLNHFYGTASNNTNKLETMSLRLPGKVVV